MWKRLNIWIQREHVKAQDKVASEREGLLYEIDAKQALARAFSIRSRPLPPRARGLTHSTHKKWPHPRLYYLQLHLSVSPLCRV